jgi:hypothetical protein
LPLSTTAMDRVVAPLDQSQLAPSDAVSCTGASAAQVMTGPAGAIVAAGALRTAISFVALAVHPL